MISKVCIYKCILELSEGRESAHIFRFKYRFKNIFKCWSSNLIRQFILN